MEWTEIAGAAAVIVAAIVVIAKAIVKLTPGTKDDEVVASIEAVVNPIVAKVSEVASSSDASSESNES